MKPKATALKRDKIGHSTNPVGSKLLSIHDIFRDSMIMSFFESLGLIGFHQFYLFNKRCSLWTLAVAAFYSPCYEYFQCITISSILIFNRVH